MSDSVRPDEIRIDSLTEKKRENLIYLASMAENEEREVWDVIEENDEYYDLVSIGHDRLNADWRLGNSVWWANSIMKYYKYCITS